MRVSAREFSGIKGPTGRGILADARSYAEKRTGSRSTARFLLEGLLFSALGNFPTVLGSLLRPLAYRLALGRIGPGGYIERNVRFNAPRRVYFGARVLVGEHTLFDVVDPRGRILVGDDVKLPRYGTFIAGPGEIAIAKRVSVGTFSHLAGHGGISLGENCLIATHVAIMSYRHGFSDRAVPVADQDIELKPVAIEEDVWIGTHALILPGVRIGRGSIVGAGAVVTSDLPPYSVAVGSPARVIRRR